MTKVNINELLEEMAKGIYELNTNRISALEELKSARRFAHAENYAEMLNKLSLAIEKLK